MTPTTAGPVSSARLPKGYVRATAREIAKHIRPGQLVILESTTYPGTTEEAALPILAQSALSSDAKLWAGLPLVVDTRNMIGPLFQDGGGPKRLVKA